MATSKQNIREHVIDQLEQKKITVADANIKLVEMERVRVIHKLPREVRNALNQEYYNSKIDIKLNDKTYQSVVDNVETFVLGKNISFVNEISEASDMIDKIEDFNTRFDEIWDKYNSTYLDSETDYIEKSTETSQLFDKYEPEDLLMFMTVGDDAVDDECDELDGLTYRADDEFWETHTPPLHINCRCSLDYVEDGKESPDKNTDTEIDDNLASPYFEGKCFSDSNPYIKLADE